MNTLRFGVIALAAGFCGTCPAAEQKKEAVELPPFSHEYYWHEFTLSKEEPKSADGRYRLKSVRKNGDVALLCYVTPEKAELIVVKPMPKKMQEGVRPLTIVVAHADAEKQLATIRELKMK